MATKPSSSAAPAFGAAFSAAHAAAPPSTAAHTNAAAHTYLPLRFMFVYFIARPGRYGGRDFGTVPPPFGG